MRLFTTIHTRRHGAKRDGTRKFKDTTCKTGAGFEGLCKMSKAPERLQREAAV